MADIASLRTCGSWDTGLDGTLVAPSPAAEEAADPDEPVVVAGGAPAEEEDPSDPAASAAAWGLLECEHELADHTTAAAMAALPAIARADERGDAEAPRAAR